MELEVLTRNLKEALSNVERLSKKSPTLQILDNTLIEAEKNFLKLTATNLETSAVWWVLAKITKEGKAAVPASFLSNFIGYLRDEKLKLKTENKNLLVESEHQKAAIQGIDPEEFPIIPAVEKQEPIEVEGAALWQGLAQLVEIPSPSQVRPEISGIYFSFSKEKIKMVATDSFRLAEKTMVPAKKPKKESSFILPQASGRELANVLGQKQATLRVYLDPNQVLFEWPGQETSHPQIHLLSRLVEGEYPNYQEIIPRKYTGQITLKREDFLNQIKEAGLFSGKVSEVKLTPLPKEKKLRIFAQSPELGRNEAFLAAKIEADRELPETAFNYRFLIDGLQNIKSSEVVLSLSAGDGPGVLRPVGDRSYLYILMPIKAS